MSRTLTVGMIGDQLPEYRRAQHAAVEMIARAAAALDVEAEVRWLATPTLEGPDAEALLAEADALWASPGSPYLSMEGAHPLVEAFLQAGLTFRAEKAERAAAALSIR